MGLDVLRLRDPDRIASARVCNLDVIDLCKMAGGCVLSEFYSFGITLEAKNPVVQHDDRNRNLHADQCFKLGPTVRKSPISHQRYNIALRCGDLGSDCKGNSPPKSCKTPGVSTRVLSEEILSCPRTHIDE